MGFFVYLIFFFQFRITWLFCNVLFCNIGKLIWFIIYLHLLSLLTCLILFWLLLTLFLLTSLLICLLTLSLSINIKRLSLFSFFTDINGLFEVPTPHLFWPLRLLNLTKISDPPPPSFILTPLFIKHLRVVLEKSNLKNFLFWKLFCYYYCLLLLFMNPFFAF